MAAPSCPLNSSGDGLQALPGPGADRHAPQFTISQYRDHLYAEIVRRKKELRKAKEREAAKAAAACKSRSGYFSRDTNTKHSMAADAAAYNSSSSSSAVARHY